jgi:phenylalanyl-tRNA synthetase beta chain
MKFSEQWLRTMANPTLDSPALADALTMAGLEVEAREPAGPVLDHVVVARIQSVDPHPNADRLRVCRVDAGDGSSLTVVCGAPNAAAGLHAPLAHPGATLPDGTVISETSVRGVVSQGMLCSAKELGLNEDASGLLVLDASIAPGTPLGKALALDDTLLTLKLTPNRADCLSILGVAREVSAITGAALVAPPVSRVRTTSDASHRVRIEDAQGCPRFASRVLQDVNARAPTPAWMKQRLERSGIRSIAAIVDITNYVMLELGQPLHAYDRERLEGDVVVRFAKPGEKLLLLNGDTLDLDEDLLLVCDERKPLGLAGIMGGEYSGIGEATTNVLLEGAFWNPAVVQGRMRRFGFTSDAGYRFERGVDFELPPRAVDRATELMLSICGGVAGPLSDIKAALPERPPVRVRPSRVTRLLGMSLSEDQISDVFARLRFSFTRERGDFVVTPPSYRYDLAIEEDFVEEVARIHGFDSIPARIGMHVPSMPALSETDVPIARLRERLVARDWNEIVTFGFVDSAVEQALDPSGAAIRVLNPIAAQRDVMRRTLLPGLLEVLQTNVNRRQARVRLFEIGRVYNAPRAAESAQPLRLGGLAFGDALPEQWGSQPARGVDFFDVKGDLEALCAPRMLTTERSGHPALHPGRSASVSVDGEAAGWLGELHPRLVRHFGLPRPPIVFELDAAVLRRRAVPTARPVSRQPVVRRDIAVVIDEGIAAQAVLDALRSERAPHVESLAIFDVYRGTGLPPGRKSLAILVLMQDTQRTLTDADIDATVADIVSLLSRRFGATLRT